LAEDRFNALTLMAMARRTLFFESAAITAFAAHHLIESALRTS
jgi:hypothetical protein